jgi:phosphatidylserine decarboxylase
MVVAFFRDPERDIPAGDNLLVAPADGKVTDIIEVDEQEFIQGRARRIGIFLSVADVHINRSPCGGRVAYEHRRHGRCFNALRSEKASAENEAHSIGVDCPGHPAGRVLVKQITGAIARRIVADVRPDQRLACGERIGMIKFGSRTELFFPCDERALILVGVGDVVRGGRTILVEYGPAGESEA